MPIPLHAYVRRAVAQTCDAPAIAHTQAPALQTGEPDAFPPLLCAPYMKVCSSLYYPAVDRGPTSLPSRSSCGEILGPLQRPKDCSGRLFSGREEGEQVALVSSYMHRGAHCLTVFPRLAVQLIGRRQKNSRKSFCAAGRKHLRSRLPKQRLDRVYKPQRLKLAQEHLSAGGMILAVILQF